MPSGCADYPPYSGWFSRHAALTLGRSCNRPFRSNGVDPKGRCASNGLVPDQLTNLIDNGYVYASPLFAATAAMMAKTIEATQTTNRMKSPISTTIRMLPMM